MRRCEVAVMIRHHDNEPPNSEHLVVRTSLNSSNWQAKRGGLTGGSALLLGVQWYVVIQLIQCKAVAYTILIDTRHCYIIFHTTYSLSLIHI